MGGGHRRIGIGAGVFDPALPDHAHSDALSEAFWWIARDGPGLHAGLPSHDQHGRRGSAVSHDWATFAHGLGVRCFIPRAIFSRSRSMCST